MKNKLFLTFLPLVLSSLSGCKTVAIRFVGFGTKASPYLIGSKADIVNLSSIFQNNAEDFSKSYYRVISDIDMADTPIYAIGNPFTPFSGNFDGNGHTIKNLNFKTFTSCGLFGYVGEGANIHNLNLDYSFTTQTAEGIYFGGVAGYVEKNTIIDNCSFTGSIGFNNTSVYTGVTTTSSFYQFLSWSTYALLAPAKAVGGIAGVSGGTISNCKVNGSLVGTICGGIAGETNGTISNCTFNNSYIYSAKSCGSIVGLMKSSQDSTAILKDCVAKNNTFRTTLFSGGLVGASYGNVEIKNNLAYGSMTNNFEQQVKTTIGDLIGAVLYEEVGSNTSKVEEAKQDSINKNSLKIHHNLVSFDYSIVGTARNIRLHFPYLEEGSILEAHNNISLLRINRDDANYSYDINVRDGYSFYQDETSQIQIPGATPISDLNKQLVASTLEIDENLIREVNINGLIGYEY